MALNNPYQENRPKLINANIPTLKITMFLFMQLFKTVEYHHPGIRGNNAEIFQAEGNKVIWESEVGILNFFCI
jgi:hypothetical protein